MKSFTTNSVIYRKANIDDAHSIVNISLEIWRTTYKGLVSEKVIEARFETLNNRIEKTIDFIKSNNGYIVAEIDHTIVGYVHYLKSDDDKFLEYGQIKALYIKDINQRNGIGEILFENALNELKLMGFKGVVIDCLVGNSANEFYLKMGTHIDSIKEENFMNEILIENVHIMNL